MWEMRVMQLGFEQRAPVGCLQYFRSPNGTLKTFNYLPNGRYLAEHDYLLCVRQDKDMCGIAYQPCTRDSFRIGPGRIQGASNAINDVISTTTATTNGGNAVNLNASIAASANNSDASDVVEGSGAGSPPVEQEMIFTSSTSSMSPFGRRCRDRILIPCDFEEFITVHRVIIFFTRNMPIDSCDENIYLLSSRGITWPVSAIWNTVAIRCAAKMNSMRRVTVASRLGLRLFG